MVIIKKPVSNEIKEQRRISALTDAIISKGGGSPISQSYAENKNIKITIRLSTKVIHLIDNYLEQCLNSKSRTCWVREAIEEKITKDITS